MLTTRFTVLVGCRVSIQQAAMGSLTVALAAAVADEGGLGMVGAPMVRPAGLEAALDALADRTEGALGVNFLMPFLDRTCLPIAARGARVVEFFSGEPDRALVAEAHEGGALVSWQVGSVREAVVAAEAGCDLVVVQGVEAGGHVRGRRALLPLLAEVVEAVDAPVVAAGGIATGRSVAAALAAGAAAVRVGTRFVAAEESRFHRRYVELLLGAGGEDTVLTEAFSVMWPDAPHRVLRSCLEAAEAFDDDVVGEMELGGEWVPLPRFAAPSSTQQTRGAIDTMALFAGEGVGAVRRIEPAADIIRELAVEAACCLEAVAPPSGAAVRSSGDP